MLKKSIAVVFAIALAMTATVASAQLCNIAAYGDADGVSGLIEPTYNEGGFPSFSIFVVMFAEDTAAAAAYSMDIPGFGTEVFLNGRYSGPSGGNLFIDDVNGTNVALGECVVGYGGYPVLVARYDFACLPTYGGGAVSIGANPDQLLDGVPSTTPLYVTCVDVTKSCSAGADLYISAAIDSEATSFSSIKSLYN